MTGLVAIAKRRGSPLNPKEIIEGIDPLGSLRLRTSSKHNLLLCVGHHDTAPCSKAAFSAFDDHGCLLAGDVINDEDLNWGDIKRCLVSGGTRIDGLRELRGAFALVVTDEPSDRMWVVTDPSAWLPVLLAQTDDAIAVSTSLAAIIRAVPEVASANENWIFETLYFNHGIGSTTPVIGTHRMPPGTITEIDLQSWRVTQRPYRGRPNRLSRLITGNEAIEEAISTFRDTVPRYFPDNLSVTMGISEGLDCRTVLAALPEPRINELHSFTFGRAASTEINEAGEIARQLGLTHTPVLLEQPFLDQLPKLARDTVFFSDGQQNINRSHLLHTYGSLQHDDRPYSVIMTGVSGDHIFRDHIQGWGNVPHIMSAHAAAQHRNGRMPVDKNFYSGLLGNKYAEFENRIEKCLDDIEQVHGEFGDPGAYYSYLMFEAGPRYFGGQAAIANSFSTFRTPYWDPDIVELGYRLQNATIGLSEALPNKDPYRETLIQAAVVAAHKKVGALPYKRLPISVYARGNKAVFRAHVLLRKLRSLLGRYSFVYSEDWPLWYRNIMKAEIQRLLGEDSRMRGHVSADFIAQAISNNDVHWIGKLLTAEYTLRFIEKGWKRY